MSGEFLTAEYLRLRMPATIPPRNSAVDDPISYARYDGTYGHFAWQGGSKRTTFWINGELANFATMTVDKFEAIAAALEIEFPQDERALDGI